MGERDRPVNCPVCNKLLTRGAAGIMRHLRIVHDILMPLTFVQEWIRTGKDPRLGDPLGEFPPKIVSDILSLVPKTGKVHIPSLVSDAKWKFGVEPDPARVIDALIVKGVLTTAGPSRDHLILTPIGKKER